MKAYYNEINPHAAQWLRNLIAADLIADGDVDERDIKDVRAADLVGYTQCHFFSGIGGWSYALRLAGWPDDRPVWTGSCPCQPFSAAGKKQGMQDDRHLWPVWFGLIRERRPVTVFGEQVEAAINHGWLDLVCDDLENEGYAVGSVGLPAACVGAPHIRQRLWFVADASRCEIWTFDGESKQINGSKIETGRHGVSGKLADTNDTGLERRCGIKHTDQGAVGKNGMACGMGDATCERRCKTRQCVAGQTERTAGASAETWNACQSVWSGADWIFCRDNKWRPVEPGIEPLANGVSGRVGALQAYGNAIVPHVAAEVIRAYMEIR